MTFDSLAILVLVNPLQDVLGVPVDRNASTVFALNLGGANGVDDDFRLISSRDDVRLLIFLNDLEVCESSLDRHGGNSFTSVVGDTHVVNSLVVQGISVNHGSDVILDGEQCEVRSANLDFVVMIAIEAEFRLLYIVGVCAELAVLVEDLECDVTVSSSQTLSTESRLVGGNDNDFFPTEVAAEDLLSEGLAGLGVGKHSVVDDDSYLATSELVGVSSVNIFGQTEFYSLLDVAPRISQVLVTKSTNNHGQSVTIGDAIVRCELGCGITFDDTILVCVRERAQVLVGRFVTDVFEGGVVGRAVFPLSIVYPTGRDTGNEQSHLVTLNSSISVSYELSRGGTLEDTIVGKELDSIILGGVGLLNSCVNGSVVCGYERSCGQSHQAGEDQRKNFFHLLVLLKSGFSCQERKTAVFSSLLACKFYHTGDIFARGAADLKCRCNIKGGLIL